MRKMALLIATILSSTAMAQDPSFSELMELAKNAKPLVREAALVALWPFADRPEVLELARQTGYEFAKDKNHFVADKAMALLGRHFVEVKRLGTDPDPKALEIARELWQMNEPVLQEQILSHLSVAHYLAVENFYIEVFNAGNFETQIKVMQRAVQGNLLLSERLELAMVKLSQDAQYNKQRQIVARFLQQRDSAKLLRASCAQVVAHVEGHDGKLLERP